MEQTNPVIAVVDDDPSMTRMLRRVLSFEGFEVQCFGSAEEFLEASNSHYACLILDVDLPGMSGVKLQESLTDKESDIPVIFMSGECDAATQQHVLDAGAAQFFRKPFNIKPFLLAVRSIACLTFI